MLRWQIFFLVFLLLGIAASISFAVINTRGYYRFGEKNISGKAQFVVELQMEDKEGRTITKRFVPSEYAIWSSVQYPETKVTKITVMLYIEVTAYAVKKTSTGYFTIDTKLLRSERRVLARGNYTPKDLMTKFLDYYYITKNPDQAYQDTIEEMGEYTNWTTAETVHEDKYNSWSTVARRYVQKEIVVPDLTDPVWGLEWSFGFNISVTAQTLGGREFTVGESLIPPSDFVIRLVRMDWGYITIVVSPPSIYLQTSSFFDVENTYILQMSLLVAQTISLWLSIVLLILEIRKRL